MQGHAGGGFCKFRKLGLLVFRQAQRLQHGLAGVIGHQTGPLPGRLQRPAQIVQPVTQRPLVLEGVAHGVGLCNQGMRVRRI